jgi:hypothetical protein
MLGDDPGHDARALAAKADKLWAYHSHQQPNAVAAVAAAGSDEEEESQIAAVRGAAKGCPQRAGQSGPGGNKKGGGGNGKGAGPSPASLARNSSGLCIFHWRFGDKAHTASPPAAGRETSDPGVSQRRCPRYTGSHRGRDHRKAFSCRYWRFF